MSVNQRIHQVTADESYSGDGVLMTPTERERDEQLRMNELWDRLSKVSDEIRNILKMKESLRPE